MRTLYRSLLGIACCAFVLNCSGRAVAQTAGATASASQSTSAAAESAAPQPNVQVGPLPDSPSSSLAALEMSPQSGGIQSSDNAAPAPAQQPQKPQRPVGTAAAEAPKVSGITAAEPAGVAIAPAKQHRVRKIVLKVGAIVGAGAAVGTVIALTAGTSSKPPGAH